MNTPEDHRRCKKSFKIMKQWNNKDEGPTPPPSDDDDVLVIDGESYIKEVTEEKCYIREGGFTDDDDEIEPSQMDKIVT